VPLYRKPDDLVMVDLGEFRENLKGERIAGRVIDGRLRPYEDRTRIEGGALKGRDLEMVWVDDPVDAFFLHIQGSGRITLEDGSVMRVGYAGQNGHPYIAVGRELIARGVLTKENVSMQSIREWLHANPGEASGLMNKNPSFVFFRPLDGEGPLGAQGVALTPGRSLAVDRSFVPYGLPVWLDAQDPLDGAARVRRLMVAQDTGGAIRGPVRGDVFWGHGADAELRAGRMKSPGRYYLLIPRTVIPMG
jgi:membrane-bound lytic murein transglycosylase A